MALRTRPSVRAVIFDMDGLLLDTERVSMECLMEAAKESGLAIPEKLYLSVVGRDIEATEAILREALGEDFPFTALTQLWRARSEARMLGGIPKKPGAEELLAALKRRTVPLALATSTHRREALERMRTARLWNYFHVTVAGDQIEHGKPAPDIFLHAAHKLDVEPEHCLVFEDSAPGVRAAHAAGMQTILIPDLAPPSARVRGLATHVFESLPAARRFVESLLPEPAS